MSEVTRMYELLYEERWDEKSKRNDGMKRHFFTGESDHQRIPIEELFDVLDAGVWAYQTRYLQFRALVHSF